EREVAAVGARGPGLQKTSDPAGRLQGRSGWADSFLRQMREQTWLCLSYPAFVDVSENERIYRPSGPPTLIIHGLEKPPEGSK
ncbi:hypothetical protein KUCAC02_016213, partial [Chaenocephalus aceratus]